MALALTPPLFALLAILIEEKSGVHYGPSDLELVVDRLSTRAQDQGFTSLLDYYYFLRYDAGGPAELVALVETLLVHETYFFREHDQLRALFAHIVKPLTHQQRRARLWSAACSTGEEPLTLAMMFAAEQQLDCVEIVASDYSTRALAKARGGRYGKRSIRAQVPVAGLFLEENADGYAIDRKLLAAIDWRRVNLTDEAQVLQLGQFDVIMCKNALIYFDDATVRRVVASLTKALNPNGVLVVGVSESLIRFGTQLRCEEHGGAFFYRKIS